MNRLLKRLLALVFLVLSTHTFAVNGNTVLGPYLRLGYANLYDPTTSYALFAEAGKNNYRLNGTVGLKADDFQRFKVSAEFLRQNITYAFATGNADQWMNQGAVGANYQYNFIDTVLSPIVDINGYLSHAPSSTLASIQQTSAPFIFEERRIAGSFASGFGTGFAVQPWKGGLAGVNLNYDDVIYDTENITTDKNAQGVGGGLTLKQSFNDMVDFGVAMDWRQPYNSVAGNIDLFNINAFGNTRVSVDYTYLRGKNSLPSSHNIGLGIIYMPDQTTNTTPQKFKDTNYKDKPVRRNEPREDFLTWTTTPAVYIPEVLAIADPATPCLPPTFSGIIPANDSSTSFSIPTAQFFTGTNLNFSITFTPDPGFNISISPTTGVITLSPGGDFGTVTVTATNSCGTASSNGFLVGPGA